MLKKLRLLKYFVFIFLFLVVFGFNSYLNKCFNEINNNNSNNNYNNHKENSITEKKNSSYDDVSVLLSHIEFSRDFYRYKCKNRQRIGADQKYLKKISDKLYRIEGRIYTKNLLYITLA